jgi:hypothetical protein
MAVMMAPMAMADHVSRAAGISPALGVDHSRSSIGRAAITRATVSRATVGRTAIAISVAVFGTALKALCRGI